MRAGLELERGNKTMKIYRFSFALPALMLAVALLTSGVQRLDAQAITAKLVGTVTDPSGAAVPGATVTVTNQATNAKRSDAANEVGSYEFSFLTVGTYTVSVESEGFQRSRVTNISLDVEQVARVDLTLQIGEVSEVVSVEADALTLQTEDAVVGTVIDSKKVVDLPLNGRSFIQLAQLTPGVVPGTPGSITVRRRRGSVGQDVGMSANGARDTQNRFYYDGIEAMDLDSYSFSFSPSIDAIEQFKVQSSTYSAEVGGAPGGQVNVMTKSGGNSFHGGAWWFNRNDAFAALPAFTPNTPDAKPPKLNRNQYGANIGGPIVSDKLFFFFNWESGRQVAGQNVRTANVPTPALRQGDFSAAASTVYDPDTGNPFPNNHIPTARIRNYASTFLNQFTPMPNATGSTAFNFLAPSGSAPIDQDQYITRVDYRFNDKNTLYGSYMINEQEDNNVGFLTEWDNQRGNTARAQNATLTDMHVFGGSLQNEMRLGWHRFFEHEFFGTTDDSSLDIANIIGIPGVSNDPRNFGPPNFSTGYNLPGIRGIGPRDRLNQIWQFSDNVSIEKGNHSIRIGGMIARRNWTFDESVNPRGSFSFDRQTLSGGAAGDRDTQFGAFLLGLATDAQVSVEPFATRMNNFWHGYYVNDSWRVTPRLTLTMGVRYEYFSVPAQRGGVANFDLGGAGGFSASEQWIRGVPGFTDTPVGGDVPTNFVNSDKNNFGPRFGFAYRAPGETVIRGGYGIYFTPEITNSWTVMTLNAPIVNTFDFSGTFNDPVQVETAFLGGGQANPTFGAFAVDPNLRDTYTQQWNLTIQKRLPLDFVFDVGYVGSKGTNLTLGFDANRPLAIVDPSDPTIASLASRRPLDGFSGINTAKSIASSTYHSLQVKLERRLARGLSTITSYTWAKTLSNADISTVGGGSFLNGVQDVFDLSNERSPAIFDIRHRASVAVLYDLPGFDKQHGAVRKVFGGWQASSIMTFSTGFASRINGVGDTTGTGVSSRPSIVAGQNPVIDGGGDRNRWFNTDAFFVTPNGQFGNAQRHPIYLPGTNNIDFSMVKNIRFSEEGHNVQLRFEFFNFFNHVNLGAPGLDVTVPETFGVITTASQGAAGVNNDARIIQFGLKYAF